jgi:hypothetical protein
MASSNLVRWGGLAAILSGALVIAMMLLTGLVAEGFFYLLILVFLLLAVAVSGIHAQQAGRSGLMGRIGFVVTLISAVAIAVLSAAVGVAENFFGFDPEGSAAIGIIFWGVFLPFIVGLIVLGIATIRAGVLPRGAAVLLILGLPLGIVIDLLTGAFFSEEATPWGFFVSFTAFAVGLIWLGYALRSGRGVTADQPSRVR